MKHPLGSNIHMSLLGWGLVYKWMERIALVELKSNNSRIKGAFHFRRSRLINWDTLVATRGVDAIFGAGVNPKSMAPIGQAIYQQIFHLQ